MPRRPGGGAADAREMKDHWKMFTENRLAQEFQPSAAQDQFLASKLRDASGRFHCQESYCSGGMFVPPICSARHRRCATLLARAPGISHMFNSSLVIQQILDQKLLVKVVFVGDHLDEVVDELEATQSKYLVLHFSPSVLVLKHKLVPILFPPCRDPLLQRNHKDPVCYYAANRLSKVVWKNLQTYASELYTFLQAFGFSSYEEYVNLLQIHVDSNYAVDDDEAYEKTVCKWMRQNLTAPGTEKVEMRYQNKLSKLQPVEKPQLYIGGIFPITGTKYKAPELAAVAMIAVQDVNNSTNILPDHQLSLDIQDGQCEADVVMKRFIDIIKTNDASKFRSTVGMLGPACSDTVEPIAGVAKHFRTVVISYSAEGTISNSNSKEYPYFFRTIAENKQYKFAYIQTMKRLGWSKVAALTQDGQKYSDYMPALQDAFQANEFEFMENRKFPEEASTVEKMKEYLEGLKEKGAKVIIGDFYSSSARIVMCTAFKLEMTQKEGYVWFLPGWYDEDWYDVDALRMQKEEKEPNGDKDSKDKRPSFGRKTTDKQNIGPLPSCTTEEMTVALNGHLSLLHEHLANEDVRTEDNRTVAEWTADMSKSMKTIFRNNKKQQAEFERTELEQQALNDSSDVHFNINNTKQTYALDLPGNVLNKYSGYVYDAVWLYAKSLDTLVKQSNKSYLQNLHSNRTVEELVKIINKMDFQGVSGRINFKGRTSRLSNIRIMQWRQPANSSKYQYIEVGEYEPNYDQDLTAVPGNASVGKLTEWDSRVIVWQTPDGKKPLDNPKECGILSSFATHLDIECQLAITIAFIIGFAVLLLNLFIVLLVFKRRYEMKMRATEERMRALGLLTPMSVLTLDEWEIPRDRVVINRRLGEGAFGAVYGGESFFDEKGWVAVAVKTLKAGSTVDEKIDFLSEAEMMKRFDHRNIVKLLGVCTRNEPVYMVMEFMLYGDLKTYLLARRHLVNERNREELDEVSNKRLTSMAYDIAKGLDYLAEQKYVHRDIACRNCLVNSSRTVKLADFGMTRPMFESDYYRFSKKGMLPVRWMSPESLSDGLFTPMSDIWSFGVLLYEMITFGSFPFQGLSNNQVLVHVKAGNTLTIPQGIKSQMALLLRTCFSHTPTKRPSAAEIVELLLKHPRLVSPCIDVPLASVQIERTDSLEMMPKPKKEATSHKDKHPHLKAKAKELSPEDQGYGSGAYSPMNGREDVVEMSVKEPLMQETFCQENDQQGTDGTSTMTYPGSTDSSPYILAHVGSYVPTGYIMLDHSPLPDYSPFSKSVSSI